MLLIDTVSVTKQWLCMQTWVCLLVHQLVKNVNLENSEDI